MVVLSSQGGFCLSLAETQMWPKCVILSQLWKNAWVFFPHTHSPEGTKEKQPEAIQWHELLLWSTPAGPSLKLLPTPTKAIFYPSQTSGRLKQGRPPHLFSVQNHVCYLFRHPMAYKKKWLTLRVGELSKHIWKTGLGLNRDDCIGPGAADALCHLIRTRTFPGGSCYLPKNNKGPLILLKNFINFL